MSRHINPNDCDCVDPFEVTHDHSCKNYCDRCDCVHCKEANQSEVCRECIACDDIDDCMENTLTKKVNNKLNKIEKIWRKQMTKKKTLWMDTVWNFPNESENK